MGAVLALAGLAFIVGHVKSIGLALAYAAGVLLMLVSRER